MKPNQLATLVLRLMGVYCLVQTLNAVPLLFSAFTYLPHPPGGQNYFSDDVRILLVAITFAIRFFIAYVLLTRPGVIANRLAPPDTTQPANFEINWEYFQVLAFAVAGIIIFSDTLPQLSSVMLGFAYRPGTYSWQSGFMGVGSLLKAVLGLWMFLSPGSFVGFWQSFRSFATPEPPRT